MRKLVIVLSLILAGCGKAALQPTHMTPNEISFRWDPFMSGMESATSKAEEHCAKQDRKAVLVNHWSNLGGLGMHGATFRCE